VTNVVEVPVTIRLEVNTEVVSTVLVRKVESVVTTVLITV
jgi:hypothetical protein